MQIPPLRQRILPLVLTGWVIAAIRLGLDFSMPDSAFTMAFGVYYVLPVVVIYIGLTRKWGRISWWQMAVSMLLVGVLVLGVWSSIAYTTGQFMEWGHGRFHSGGPMLYADGTPILGADGQPIEAGARASLIQEGPLDKIGVGLLHGLGSSGLGSIWFILFGSVFIWVPARLGSRKKAAQP